MAATPVPTSVPAWLEPSRDGKAFVSRMAQGSMLWTGNKAVLQFEGSPESGVARIEWQLKGANADAALSGLDKMNAASNYFRGNDRSKWRTGVAHYARALAKSVYPGIDVVWYAQNRMLEYDFIVAPGSDPSAIRIAFDGVSNRRVDQNGDLLLDAAGVTIRQHKPIVTQQIDGKLVTIDARYELASNGEIAFNLGRYDRSHELVIDPAFSYAGFIGGAKLDVANGVVIDSEGAMWIAGSSSSEIWFPEDYVTVQRENAGNRDAFLARVLPAEGGGGTIDYWTYLGGAGNDEATAITQDKNGYLYLTGTTTSNDFPMGGNAYQTVFEQNDIDAFVIKFDPRQRDEFALLYSSYYGGEGREFPQAIAVRDDGYVAIAGYTTAGELPGAAESAIQPSNRGGYDAFFAVFNPDALTASETLYKSSFYGGDSTDVVNGVAWDLQGRLILVGSTMSTDFPIEGPYFQGMLRGGDAFIVAMDFTKPGLDSLVYGTYLGGWMNDVANAVQVDANGFLWITGYTLSDDFYTTENAPQRSLRGAVDAFLIQVDITKPGADFFKYSTYFGGSGAEIAYGLALEPRGAVTIVGYSMSNDFPNKNPLFPVPETVKLTDAFYASFNPAANGEDGVIWAMLHGGNSTDVAASVATDAHNNLAIAGFTASADLPTAAQTGKQNGAGLYTGWFLFLKGDPQ